MKTRLAPIAAGISVAWMISSGVTAFAVEGAMGRPISGTTIMPYEGVVPPAPGFAVSVGETYYSGSIGGSTTIPVAQNLTVGIDLKASFTPVSVLYVWDTGTTNWNFASAISLPVAWMEAEANVTLGPITGQRKDSAFGLFDLAFVPITAGYHFSPTEHLALSFTVWAPTGEYDPNDLANLSMNTWTFIPGVAYTKIFPKPNIELSGSWSVNFDTKNNDTGYQNGILSDLELMAVKRFKCGAGVGLIGSWIEQLTDDQGSVADTLNGFKGRAFGVGPVLTYSRQVGKHDLEINARWVHEFENKNYIEGNVFMLNATLKF